MGGLRMDGGWMVDGCPAWHSAGRRGSRSQPHMLSAGAPRWASSHQAMCTAAAACAHFDRPSAGFELLLFSDRQPGGLTGHDERLWCTSAETRYFLERLCFQLLALPLSLAPPLPSIMSRAVSSLHLGSGLLRVAP